MNRCKKLLCTAIGTLGGLAAGAASAAPVTYSVFAYTDISLNGKMFHDAAVTMTFTGDTGDVQPFCVPDPSPNPCNPKTFHGQASGWQISNGNAKVAIANAGRTLHATFKPNQIMVTFDYYNGGAGFSSTVNGTFEPAYPFTVDGGTVSYPMPDLVTDGVWSGHAWSCIGFPPQVHHTVCGDPTAHPLNTDAGPLVVFQSYQQFVDTAQTKILSDYTGSLNNGFFTTLIHQPDDE